MAFRDFTFPQVQHDLGLTVHDADLFSAVPSFAVSDEFAGFLHEGVELALAVGTEKGKSEFIIAPVLLELRRVMSPELFTVFGCRVECRSGPRSERLL